MTDEEHVTKVCAAVDAMSDAIREARKAGLTVDLVPLQSPVIPYSVQIKRVTQFYPTPE